MKRVLMIVIALALAALVVMRLAGGSDYWRRYFAADGSGAASLPASLIEPLVVIKGGDGGGAPVSTAADEGFEPAAVKEADKQAQALGFRALIVRRHGHVVLASFAKGLDRNSEMAGGDLSALPLALALGAMVDEGKPDAATALRQLQQSLLAGTSVVSRNPWSASSRAELSPPVSTLLPPALGAQLPAEVITQRVWQPIHAAPAALWGTSDRAVRLDCCMVARIEDWMRLGDVLLQQGSFEGERIASPGWVRRLLAGDGQGKLAPVWVPAQRSFTGDEPPAARETLWVDLGPDARLWLVPQRQLAILVWANAGSSTPASDTLIPNIIIRGIVDQALPTLGPPALHDLVPGHQ
jgi:hypothetical protein